MMLYIQRPQYMMCIALAVPAQSYTEASMPGRCSRFGFYRLPIYIVQLIATAA